ncbi:MAG: hypothetical protein GY711_15300 [bacterium]|nr:hypothetical protein [bacterium]
MSLLRWILLTAVLAAGLQLRLEWIASPALWADEAESSLNALTILQHGYPTSEYLEQPLFENILHVEWPESEEYEFRDASYSADGIACYHGWLPLYAIALSMRVFGVEPDTLAEDHHIQHDRETMHRRTWVPRIPAILFSAAFLLVVFFGTKEMVGDHAAWAAIVLAAIHGRLVDFGWQARYYAPTLLFSFAAAWAIWRTIEKGRTRDALVAGLVLVLLFHTHMLSSLALCASLALCTLVRRGARTALRHSAVAGTVVVLGSLPWMLGTGFFEVLGQPPARELLSLPGDLFGGIYELRIIGPLLLALLAAALLLQRFTFRMHPTAWTIAAVWPVLALAGFLGLMPAATFFIDRLELLLLPPYVLAIGAAVEPLARKLPKWTAPLAGAPVLALVVLTRQHHVGWWTSQPRAAATYALVERIDDLTGPDTRVYSTPSRHLMLTYYSGLPVQSIAPVRESYLESYAGDILLVAGATFGDAPSWRAIQRTAQEEGTPISEAEAYDIAHLIWGMCTRNALKAEVADAFPPRRGVANWAQPFLEQAEDRWQEAHRFYAWRWSESLLFRHLPAGSITDATSYWQNYFYRFADAPERSGENVNYAGILPRATVEVRPELDAVLYRVPAP